MTSGSSYAVLFDLDGTLIDSVGDLAAAVNRVLSNDGLEPLALDDVRSMIGNGMAKLVQRAYRSRDIELDQTRLSRQYAAVLASYEADLYSKTTLLPGAVDVVAEFSKTGASVAVVTNKPQHASEAILHHFGLAQSVNLVVGGDLGIARKPAPDMIEHALTTFSVESRNALMVGDSSADVGAAANAGVRCVLVRGGYAGGESALELSDTVEIIDNLTSLTTDMLFSVGR